MDDKERKIIKTLSRQYRNIAAASTEIINLQSILNLQVDDYGTFPDRYSRRI